MLSDCTVKLQPAYSSTLPCHALRARLETLALAGAELRSRMDLLRLKSILLGRLYACSEQLPNCLAAVAENGGQRYPLQRAPVTSDLRIVLADSATVRTFDRPQWNVGLGAEQIKTERKPRA